MEREPESATAFSWLATATIILSLLTITGAYLTLLRLAIDTSNAGDPTNDADRVYFGVHGAILALSLVLGGILGYVQARRAFAIAVLFLAVILVTMFAAQLVTFELACAGHNDIIRHWQC